MKIRLAAAAVAAVLPITIITASADAATKTTKASIPAPGKACTAKNVGVSVAGPGGVLLDCIKSGSAYTWKVSKDALVTTVPTTVATAVAASTATTVVAKSDKWPDKIVFAPVPSENASAALTAYGPFAKALEDMLGIKVEQVAVSDYAAVVEGQLSGKVDIAAYGPFSYYVAKAAGAKIDPIAVTVNDIGLPPSYQSFLVAPGNSAATSIADVKGKKVCFVDNLSTSGYLYPTAGLKEVGLEVGRDYTAVFAGGHDKSVAAVKAGTCDLGFAFDDMVNTIAPASGIIKPGDLKVIWKSRSIPNSPFAVRTDLPASLVAKIKESVPKIDALYLQAKKYCPASNPNCGIGTAKAWVQVNESFFQPIADVCKLTQAPACFPVKK